MLASRSYGNEEFGKGIPTVVSVSNFSSLSHENRPVESIPVESDPGKSDTMSWPLVNWLALLP